MDSFDDESETAASIVQSAFLAVTLLFAGALLYHGMKMKKVFKKYI